MKPTTMNWIQLIQTLSNQAQPSIMPIFQPPATSKDLSLLQESLQLETLPSSLTALYLQTNGIGEEMQGIKIGDLIWPIPQAVEINLAMRAQPSQHGSLPMHNLLFFADAGNGDRFAFIAQGSAPNPQAIFAWNHETDSITPIAPDLSQFLIGWYQGTIHL